MSVDNTSTVEYWQCRTRLLSYGFWLDQHGIVTVPSCIWITDTEGIVLYYGTRVELTDSRSNMWLAAPHLPIPTWQSEPHCVRGYSVLVLFIGSYVVRTPLSAIDDWVLRATRFDKLWFDSSAQILVYLSPASSEKEAAYPTDSIH